ncbi:MAG TPA: hypothetical protein PLQ04_04955, partial [Lachnospiraceae bacterium]|nr:hypothetical protein [Lachnospiraceae bacterium]
MYRTYCGSTQSLTVGNGAIKPGTTYRVNAYYTYFDERDSVTVESLLSQIVTTQVLDPDAKIEFNPPVIEYYYDNHLEISSLSCNMTETDEEALHGVNRTGGVTLRITGKSAGVLGFVSETVLDSRLIRELKEGQPISFISVPDLKANQSYEYELVAKDYFGTELVLTNNT